MSEAPGITRRDLLKGATGAAGAALVSGGMPSRAEAQGKTLTIWHTEAADIAVKAVQKVCDRFEQTHPGVKISQQGVPWADLGPKLYTAMAAGTTPDIAQIQPYHFRSFQKKGVLIPIDDLYRAIGLDDVVESVRDMTLFQGKRWGISHHIGAPSMIVRKDLAEQAGFKVPDDVSKPMFGTWAEQIEFLKAVTKPDKRVWGMSVAGAGYFLQEHIGRWVGSNGGSFYDEKWNPQFNKGPFMGAMEYLKTLADAKVLPPDWLTQSGLGMFTEFGSGYTAMIDHGYGRIAGFIERYAPDKANEDHYRPVWRPVGPSGKTSYTDMDCELWVIFTKSKNQDLCKEWLKLFYTKEMYLNYVAQYPVHMSPSLKSLRNDPDYKALPDLKKWANWVRHQEMYIDRGLAMPVGVFYPATQIQIPFLAEVFDSGIIADEIVGHVQGRRGAKEAAQRVQDRVTDLIRKLRYPIPDPIRAEKKV